MRSPLRLAAAALASAVLVTLAAAQTAFPSKKVVFTFNPRLTETDLREIKQAAPALDLVFPTRDKLLAEIADADAIIGGVTREQVLAAKKLKWVQVNSAGVENFLSAIPELRERPITLTNMKIVQGVEIADHAFALLLGLTRRIDVAVANRANETWPSLANYGPPLELSGKTAVIVGVGGIGTQIAVRAKAFGMTVIGVDPRDIPITPFLDRTVWPDRLETVLPEADVVFISAPHTPATEKMIGAAQFAKMKKGVLFIAVSRGKIYDAMALVDALKSGHVAGAGLDVTDPEPLPKGHPLWTTGRVIITPHIAGRSDGEGARFFEIYKENLIRFGKGEPLRHAVDKNLGY
ncbi:MAG: D-2-hydroxyacid dehydrogenase [Verrucomicrobia bacterium]|nr:D-2-hydroxyacid dehydrogenase [Verrucomicrobiota bacterium]